MSPRPHNKRSRHLFTCMPVSCDCRVPSQMVEHIIASCPKHRPSEGERGLIDLDHNPAAWLAPTELRVQLHTKDDNGRTFSSGQCWGVLGIWLFHSDLSPIKITGVRRLSKIPVKLVCKREKKVVPLSCHVLIWIKAPRWKIEFSVIFLHYTLLLKCYYILGASGWLRL